MTIWFAPLGTPPPSRRPKRRVRLWIAQHILRLPVWREIGAIVDGDTW